MSKFKIGDKVKVIRAGSAPKETLGEVGEAISSGSDSCVQVKFDNAFKNLEYSTSWWYLASDLTLVEEENEVPVKPEPKQTLDKYFVEDECFTQALKNYKNQFTGAVDQSTFVVKESTVTTNEQGGVKFDNGKIDYTYLLKDLPVSVEEVTKVLIYGSRKYSRSNYSKVESERYEAACLRHIMSYLQGEQLDPETGYHHLAHAVCCLMFLVEREVKKEGDE